jgi:hypothetical protein
MSFLEDLFEGRRGGHHGQHGDHGHGHHDDRDYRGPYPANAPVLPEGRAPQVACGRCQAPVVVLPGFRFCPYCGGPLSAASACSNCGAVRTPGAAFCASCGVKC